MKDFRFDCTISSVFVKLMRNRVSFIKTNSSTLVSPIVVDIDCSKRKRHIGITFPVPFVSSTAKLLSSFLIEFCFVILLSA